MWCVAAPLIQETGARRTRFRRCLYNAVLLITESLKVALIFMKPFSLHSDLENVRINLEYLTIEFQERNTRARARSCFHCGYKLVLCRCKKSYTFLDDAVNNCVGEVYTAVQVCGLGFLRRKLRRLLFSDVTSYRSVEKYISIS